MMPTQSQLPTIGWPMCEVSASWWTQSGSLRAGASRSMRKVRVLGRQFETELGRPRCRATAYSELELA
jgi:hypothetical protein